MFAKLPPPAAPAGKPPPLPPVPFIPSKKNPVHSVKNTPGGQIICYHLTAEAGQTVFNGGVDMKRQSDKGFTLIEILIVVVILGLLAGIVIPAFADCTDDSARQSFITSVKQIARAADYHHQLTGDFFEDSASGAMPAGLSRYIQPGIWTGGTPLGGVWDFEKDAYGVRSAFGVHFNGTAPQSDAYMQTVDAAFDDGDLAAGRFRKIDADRFYYILAD